MAIYEVNEVNLSRRYTSLLEQVQAETTEKQQLQFDMAELESTLKTRILFLEQHKLGATMHLAKFQQQLNESVPRVEEILKLLSLLFLSIVHTQAEYECVTRELGHIRQEYLNTLEREVQCRSENASHLIHQDEVHRLRTQLAEQSVEVKQASHD